MLSLVQQDVKTRSDRRGRCSTMPAATRPSFLCHLVSQTASLQASHTRDTASPPSDHASIIHGNPKIRDSHPSNSTMFLQHQSMSPVRFSNLLQRQPSNTQPHYQNHSQAPRTTKPSQSKARLHGHTAKPVRHQSQEASTNPKDLSRPAAAVEREKS